MKTFMAIGLTLCILLILFSDTIKASTTDEARYCHAISDIPRDKSGAIRRSVAVIDAFKFYHPCPATGLRFGSCPLWSINHVIPLSVGGCDSVINMQWLPNAIKSCAGELCVDRFERRIYAPDFGVNK